VEEKNAEKDEEGVEEEGVEENAEKGEEGEEEENGEKGEESVSDHPIPPHQGCHLHRKGEEKKKQEDGK